MLYQVYILIFTILLFDVFHAVTILSPKTFSTHHIWENKTSTVPLEIDILIHKKEADQILSQSDSNTIISICCHVNNAIYQCVESTKNSLQEYLSKNQNIELQLHLPWERLIASTTSSTPLSNPSTFTEFTNPSPSTTTPTTIRIQVQLSNQQNHVTLTSNATTIYYHGIITTQDILSLPSYVINMKRKTSRWKTTSRRLKDSGFSNVHRWNALDGSIINTTTMEKKYNIMWGSPNHRACSASHTSLWTTVHKKIERLRSTAGSTASSKIPSMLTIFEDDALPHENFQQLLPLYVKNIPTDAEIVYIGWQRGAIQTGGKVHVDPPTETNGEYVLKRHPACLHAYILTRPALLKVLKMTLPLHDTIDGKLMRLAWQGNVVSYAFNGMKHVSAMLTTNHLHDEETEMDVNNEADLLDFDGDTEMSTATLVVSGDGCPSDECPRLVVSRMDRSRGIVFQDASFGTDIDAKAFIDDDAATLSRYSKHRRSYNVVQQQSP